MSQQADKSEMTRLMTLNKLELMLGIVIAVMTIANGVGAWWVLPYRVAAAERDVRDVRGQLDKHLKDVENKTELLIRIDERLQQMQVQMNKMQGQMETIQRKP